MLDFWLPIALLFIAVTVATTKTRRICNQVIVAIPDNGKVLEWADLSNRDLLLLNASLKPDIKRKMLIPARPDMIPFQSARAPLRGSLI